MNKLFGIILIVAVLVWACQKAADNNLPEQQQQQPLPPLSLDSMLLCHNRTTWDSTTIHSALTGKWQWKYISCYWNPESANDQAFKDLTVEFNADNTLEVKVAGQVTQQALWRIERMNDGYFKIVTHPLVVQLPGRIMFCGPYVLFYDSYVDGCDNYFRKLS